MVMVMVVVGMQVQVVLVMMVLMGIVGLNCVMWMDWRMGIPFI